MSDFVVNLVRRGAGLASSVSPRKLAWEEALVGAETGAEERIDPAPEAGPSPEDPTARVSPPEVCAPEVPEREPALRPSSTPPARPIAAAPPARAITIAASPSLAPGPRPLETPSRAPVPDSSAAPSPRPRDAPPPSPVRSRLRAIAAGVDSRPSREAGQRETPPPVRLERPAAPPAWPRANRPDPTLDLAEVPIPEGQSQREDSPPIGTPSSPVRPSAPPPLPWTRVSATPEVPRVEVKIGRVEILPAPLPLPPLTPRREPRGFAEQALARSYRDRRWY